MPATIKIEAKFTTTEGSHEKTVTIDKAVIGGWTGRDKTALQHHIDELAKIGVKPPEQTPTFYRVGVSRLTTADTIEVIGDGSSGEVEYVMLKTGGKIWVGAGSDHTDRVVEHMGITIAKQLCDKPIALEFWPLEEVEGHWEKLQLKAHIFEDGETVLYQDGAVSGLLSPAELLEKYHSNGHEFRDGTLMFGGTCGAIGGVRFASTFKFELIDPVLQRTICHSYEIEPVPILG
ncbi:MAG: hypothetical protein COA78_12720 [Blastopirellula sp.]|nr:MAG: hypothetical protein COA78_12720 [Blastopirellula sp.]